MGDGLLRRRRSRVERQPPRLPHNRHHRRPPACRGQLQPTDRPIGTHVFTAIERAGGDDMRWSVVSLKGGQGMLESRGFGGPNTEMASTDTGGAKAALDRITIPPETLDLIEASPGSSLIISNEALSSETGKGTEFVVIMSDEPQGGIRMRRRNPDTEFRYASPRNRLPYWSPFAGPYSRR